MDLSQCEFFWKPSSSLETLSTKKPIQTEGGRKAGTGLEKSKKSRASKEKKKRKPEQDRSKNKAGAGKETLTSTTPLPLICAWTSAARTSARTSGCIFEFLAVSFT